MLDPEDEAFEELALKQGQWHYTSGNRKRQIMEREMNIGGRSMTQDEIIEMARQCGFERLGHDDCDLVCYPEEVEAFAKLVAEKTLSEHAMREAQRLGQEIEQEPPKYSFKAHWEKDGRIGVVGAIVRPDGGIHLLQDFIDPPQRKPLTDEKLFKIWLSVPAETEDRYAFARAIEVAHNIKGNT